MLDQPSRVTFAYALHTHTHTHTHTHAHCKQAFDALSTSSEEDINNYVQQTLRTEFGTEALVKLCNFKCGVTVCFDTVSTTTSVTVLRLFILMCCRCTYAIAKPREFHFFYRIQKLQLKNDLNKIADAY